MLKLPHYKKVLPSFRIDISLSVSFYRALRHSISISYISHLNLSLSLPISVCLSVLILLPVSFVSVCASVSHYLALPPHHSICVLSLCLSLCISHLLPAVDDDEAAARHPLGRTRCRWTQHAKVLGASEIIANLYCNCVHLYWECCVMLSICLR